MKTKRNKEKQKLYFLAQKDEWKIHHKINEKTEF